MAALAVPKLQKLQLLTVMIRRPLMQLLEGVDQDAVDEDSEDADSEDAEESDHGD